MAALDEAALARVLAFSSEVGGRLCCRAWARHLHESLQLAHRLRVGRLLQEKGQVSYHHSAVRELGQEFEECVSYQFEFRRVRRYIMQWTRTFDGWTADNERQVGSWRIVGDRLCCESSQGPAADEGCVRYARPGLVFELPVEDVLRGHTVADDRTPAWEYAARGLPLPGHREPEPTPMLADLQEPLVRTVAAVRPEARFVEVDGEMHEVCGDIREHWPEAEWSRLMRVRLRFGIHGPV